MEGGTVLTQGSMAIIAGRGDTGHHRIILGNGGKRGG